MANKSLSVSGIGNVGNQTEGISTASTPDQQKIPPLRIVLNTGGNQRSSSTISTENNQQSSSKKRKHNLQHVQHSKSDSSLKSKVRMSTTAPVTTKNNSTEDSFNDDNSSSSFNHLRRITRRSQRTVQTPINDGEDYISSMTSIDENSPNASANESIALDSELSNSAPGTSNSTTNTTNLATNGSNSNTCETPRRYKRRKGEPSESQSLDCDALFGSQNYKIPDQNSIELYKNIRKQVDKRLRNLNSVHPKIPYGFRDYMLLRGAYLLDGNKLGNGTSLFMNEDGSLNPAPMGKYHAIRQNRTNYIVPNRARAPRGLPVNSPLYSLFVDQEKERHKMRMQHIKEREKLTLAAEQEIMRVYNRAALTASNQNEPFSACTMLKHQEIYDYLNSDGKVILSCENSQRDQDETEGVRTRRRQHGNLSPIHTTQSSKNSYADDVGTTISTAQSTDKNDKASTDMDEAVSSNPPNKQDGEKQDAEDKAGGDQISPPEEERGDASRSSQNQDDNKSVESSARSKDSQIDADEAQKAEVKVEPIVAAAENKSDKSPIDDEDSKIGGEVSDHNSDVSQQGDSRQQNDTGSNISDKDGQAHNEELFLIQLQEVDDKWDKIRKDMLVRHRNEAESLYAIQKLEWEWKAKEIGACDVRATPMIDNTLVPKLIIHSQDY